MKPCVKCGSTDFGFFTRSKSDKYYSGKKSRYCRPCQRKRDEKRKQLKKTNGGSHTRQEFLAKLNQTDCCPKCKRLWEDIPLPPNERYKNVWTEDHIVPLRHGGTDDIDNIQAVCYQCNYGYKLYDKTWKLPRVVQDYSI